jgi:hypothetical protein
MTMCYIKFLIPSCLRYCQKQIDIHCRYLFNSSIPYKNDIYPVKKKKKEEDHARLLYMHKTKQPKDLGRAV